MYTYFYKLPTTCMAVQGEEGPVLKRLRPLPSLSLPLSLCPLPGSAQGTAVPSKQQEYV